MAEAHDLTMRLESLRGSLFDIGKGGYAGTIAEALAEISRLQADKERLEGALEPFADNTYCGRDAEWHFKPGYDPQRVLDALQGGDEGKGEEPEDRDPADDGDDAWFHDSDMGAR